MSRNREKESDMGKHTHAISRMDSSNTAGAVEGSVGTGVNMDLNDNKSLNQSTTNSNQNNYSSNNNNNKNNSNSIKNSASKNGTKGNGSNNGSGNGNGKSKSKSKYTYSKPKGMTDAQLIQPMATAGKVWIASRPSSRGDDLIIRSRPTDMARHMSNRGMDDGNGTNSAHVELDKDADNEVSNVLAASRSISHSHLNNGGNLGYIDDNNGPNNNGSEGSIERGGDGAHGLLSRRRSGSSSPVPRGEDSLMVDARGGMDDPNQGSRTRTHNSHNTHNTHSSRPSSRSINGNGSRGGGGNGSRGGGVDLGAAPPSRLLTASLSPNPGSLAGRWSSTPTPTPINNMGGMGLGMGNRDRDRDSAREASRERTREKHRDRDMIIPSHESQHTSHSRAHVIGTDPISPPIVSTALNSSGLVNSSGLESDNMLHDSVEDVSAAGGSVDVDMSGNGDLGLGLGGGNALVRKNTGTESGDGMLVAGAEGANVSIPQTPPGDLVGMAMSPATKRLNRVDDSGALGSVAGVTDYLRGVEAERKRESARESERAREREREAVREREREEARERERERGRDRDRDSRDRRGVRDRRDSRDMRDRSHERDMGREPRPLSHMPISGGRSSSHDTMRVMPPSPHHSQAGAYSVGGNSAIYVSHDMLAPSPLGHRNTGGIAQSVGSTHLATGYAPTINSFFSPAPGNIPSRPLSPSTTVTSTGQIGGGGQLEGNLASEFGPSDVEIERERERERGVERKHLLGLEREREIERERVVEAERERELELDRQRGIERDRERDRALERERERERAERVASGSRTDYAEMDTDREGHRERERDRSRERRVIRERDRERQERERALDVDGLGRRQTSQQDARVRDSRNTHVRVGMPGVGMPGVETETDRDTETDVSVQAHDHDGIGLAKVAAARAIGDEPVVPMTRDSMSGGAPNDGNVRSGSPNSNVNITPVIDTDNSRVHVHPHDNHTHTRNHNTHGNNNGGGTTQGKKKLRSSTHKDAHDLSGGNIITDSANITGMGRSRDDIPSSTELFHRPSVPMVKPTSHMTATRRLTGASSGSVGQYYERAPPIHPTPPGHVLSPSARERKKKDSGIRDNFGNLQGGGASGGVSTGSQMAMLTSQKLGQLGQLQRQESSSPGGNAYRPSAEARVWTPGVSSRAHGHAPHSHTHNTQESPEQMQQQDQPQQMRGRGFERQRSSAPLPMSFGAAPPRRKSQFGNSTTGGGGGVAMDTFVPGPDQQRNMVGQTSHNNNNTSNNNVSNNNTNNNKGFNDAWGVQQPMQQQPQKQHGQKTDRNSSDRSGERGSRNLLEQALWGASSPLQSGGIQRQLSTYGSGDIQPLMYRRNTHHSGKHATAPLPASFGAPRRQHGMGDEEFSQQPQQPQSYVAVQQQPQQLQQMSAPQQQTVVYGQPPQQQQRHRAASPYQRQYSNQGGVQVQDGSSMRRSLSQMSVQQQQLQQQDQQQNQHLHLSRGRKRSMAEANVDDDDRGNINRHHQLNPNALNTLQNMQQQQQQQQQQHPGTPLSQANSNSIVYKQVMYNMHRQASLADQQYTQPQNKQAFSPSMGTDLLSPRQGTYSGGGDQLSFLQPTNPQIPSQKDNKRLSNAMPHQQQQQPQQKRYVMGRTQDDQVQYVQPVRSQSQTAQASSQVMALSTQAQPPSVFGSSMAPNNYASNNNSMQQQNSYANNNSNMNINPSSGAYLPPIYVGQHGRAVAVNTKVSASPQGSQQMWMAPTAYLSTPAGGTGAGVPMVAVPMTTKTTTNRAVATGAKHSRAAKAEATAHVHTSKHGVSKHHSKRSHSHSNMDGITRIPLTAENLKASLYSNHRYRADPDYNVTKFLMSMDGIPKPTPPSFME